MAITKRFEAWVTCDECGAETHPENDVTMPLVVAEAKRAAEDAGWYVTKRRAFCHRCDSRLRELLTTGKLESGRAARFAALMAEWDAQPHDSEETAMMDEVTARIERRSRVVIGEAAE